MTTKKKLNQKTLMDLHKEIDGEEKLTPEQKAFGESQNLTVEEVVDFVIHCGDWKWVDQEETQQKRGVKEIRKLLKQIRDEINDLKYLSEIPIEDKEIFMRVDLNDINEVFKNYGVENE